MTVPELIDAIAELRRVTPANDPWDGREFNIIPSPIDDAICVILNAVLSGELVHCRLIAEAVAAERERCARIAGDEFGGRCIADKIRGKWVP